MSLDAESKDVIQLYRLLSHPGTYMKTACYYVLLQRSCAELKSRHPSVRTAFNVGDEDIAAHSTQRLALTVQTESKRTALVSSPELLTFAPQFLEWTWHRQKTHPCSAVTQSCSHSSSLRERGRKGGNLWLSFLDLACNVLSARRGYLCNVSHSLLSHWICWHTVSGSRLWSTRSILRFCAAVDMATILVD